MSKPTKRTVLAELTVKRLSGLCDTFELDRAGLTRKDDLVDALARAKRAGLPELLESLSRDELKAICRVHGLDDSGKEKAPIMARILGDEAPAPAAAEAKPTPSKRRAAVVANDSGQLELPADRKLTVAELEKYLWSAADILRGSIDSSDYKSFIFGLLFLKRLSACPIDSRRRPRSWSPRARTPRSPGRTPTTIKKGGEFYTPNKVVETIVEVLAPTEGMRICDPTCGSGPPARRSWCPSP